MKKEKTVYFFILILFWCLIMSVIAGCQTMEGVGGDTVFVGTMLQDVSAKGANAERDYVDRSNLRKEKLRLQEARALAEAWKQ